jgi:putative FmdB family regulatory protein
MPIYEYRCSECGQDQEVLQKVSEPPLTECPACGKPALQKQLSAAGFQLKGSGWYATDFKGSGKKPVEKKADAKTEAKTEAKAETKSETKSAETKSAETKTDSKPASTSTTTD